MPKVIIWREGAIETEFDPGHRDWRMGRSETNDITLLDPRKSVSRFHAELREENGRWVFIDLNSQNGSWKDGQRVNRLVLEHGHEVLFGDYKLAFQDVKVTVPVATADEAADVKGGTADIALTPEHTLVVKTQKAVPAAPPSAPPPVLPPAAIVPPPRKGINPIIPVLVLLALLGVVAAVAWKVLSTSRVESGVVENTAAARPEPAPTPDPIPPPAPAAPDPADTTTPPVAPGVAATPETTPGNTPVAPPEVPVSAPPAAPAPPGTVDTPPSAKGAKATPPGTTPRPKRVPPPPKDDQAVVLRYDEGRRALNAARYAQAELAFQWVLQQQPGFRDTAALLARARAGLSAARDTALTEARALEASGDWAQAIAAYERAGAADQAAAARTKMAAEGENAYRKARQFDARNRLTEAMTWYQRAVEWLPDSDARKATARQRLAALKAGGP